MLAPEKSKNHSYETNSYEYMNISITYLINMLKIKKLFEFRIPEKLMADTCHPQGVSVMALRILVKKYINNY